MKYLVRALKYYVYLVLILCLIIFVMVELKLANADISTMFVHGYDSIWQMALIILAFAAVYPKFGFSRRQVECPGSDAEIKPRVLEIMDEHGYRLEKEADGVMCFVKRAPFARAVKMWEDRLTFTRNISGYEIEGLTKDLVRVASAIEIKFSLPPED